MPEGLKPVIQDRKGLGWSSADVLESVAADINVGNHLEGRSKRIMATDFEKATEVCSNATKLFETSFGHLLAAEQKISVSSRKVSGDVRKAADDLHGGPSKDREGC